ncbi:MAG: efflux RND transporter periplasmic adaptor subunit [Chloroflexi bacterium]|nr:efflux RND transporter periplasmic adaptor subunit [Chloroflexota bacterium]
MKRERWLVVFNLVVVAAVVFGGCQFLPFGETSAAAVPTTVDVKRGDLEVVATASGSLTLPKVTKLGFSGAISGSQAGNTILAELNVAVGSRVTKGQVIARLDTSGQERDLLRYRNNLETAQLNLDKAKEPLYRPEEIAKAESAIPTGRANLEVAREALKKARVPFTENDFAIAEAGVRKAEADLRNARTALASAEKDLETTTVRDNRTIQDAADQMVKIQRSTEVGRALAGTTTVGTDYDIQKAGETLELARRDAASHLAVGQNTIAKARDGVASAEVALATAQFNLNDMLSKKDGDSLEIKQREASVISAETSLANAEQTLSLMKRPPEAMDIRLRELQVAAAQLALDDALLQLEKSTIIAPFDGVIGDFKAKVGDTIQPGSFSIPLVDPTQIRVDAYIEEFDVMNIRPGMPATVTLDALPGQVLPSTVAAISPLSTVQQGVVRYAITINARIPGQGEAVQTSQGRPRPGASAPSPKPGAGGGQRGSSSGGGAARPAVIELKDGLSATATIVLNKRENVLTVPNRALVLQRGEQKVQVLVNGQAQDRKVRTGLSNDQVTEIMEGIEEGEKVIIQALPGRQQNVPKPGMGGGLGIPGLR